MQNSRGSIAKNTDTTSSDIYLLWVSKYLYLSKIFHPLTLDQNKLGQKISRTGYPKSLNTEF